MMRMRRPSVFAVAFLIFGVALFSALGVWQLRRAAYKETVLAQFHQASHAPLVDLSRALADLRVRPDAYPHVRVTGSFDAGRAYFLDDQMSTDRLGVMVFVPFTPQAGGNTLLVNLGFLAKTGADSTVMPDLPPIPDHPVTLTGIYAPPPLPGLKLGGNPLPRQATWPKTVTWIDTGEIGADLHRPLYSHVLLLDPDPGSAYLRMWTANVMPPEQHRAYALQWFSFAIVAIVMFFVLHRAERDAASTDDES
jgi:surfeit locus 1 family protein